MDAWHKCLVGQQVSRDRRRSLNCEADNDDNRITIHNASWDYGGRHPRHGTRVTSLAEVPYFDPNAPTRRQALGLLDEEEKKALGLSNKE